MVEEEEDYKTNLWMKLREGDYCHCNKCKNKNTGGSYTHRCQCDNVFLGSGCNCLVVVSSKQNEVQFNTKYFLNE